MSTQGRSITTILKTNQYAGLDSVTNVGSFVPLAVGGAGTVLTRSWLPPSFCSLVLIAQKIRSTPKPRS